MRILLVSQYFSPEITAAPLRLHPIAAGLAERGHAVEVLCGIPNHPEGVVHPGYGGRAVLRERVDGFEVTHVRTHVSRSKQPLHRVASYATFALMATAVGGTRPRPDVILASSPPLSVGVVGAMLAQRFRRPWVLDVRDLWPEVALALGQVGDSRALRLASKVERRLYRSAAAVTSVTEPFVETIEARRGAGGVSLIPNGTSRAWIEAASAPVGRAELELPEDGFLLAYAGNVGLSQNLDTALEAVRAAGPGFRLLVLGDGASRSRLEATAKTMEPGQVIFRGPVPPADAARHLAAADALLVSLADSEALGKTIPIKLYDYCAVGRPIVVAAPGEAARIAEREEIALTTAPGDAEELRAALVEIAGSPDRAAGMTERARAFAGSHLREDLVADLERVLLDVAGR
jgi:glycosyltransferase involved in cell wall biosynthesis